MASEPHCARLRVRYGETDQMGVVYHANYIVYFEIGRTEMMRALAVDYAEMEQSGASLAVIDVAVRYLRPARYDDELEVETRLTACSGVRVRFDYQVMKGGGDDRELLCTGHTVLACVDRAGRPLRLPSPWRERIAAAVG